MDNKETQAEAAFLPALTLQRQRALGAAFAHRCLTVTVWLAGVTAASLALNGYLAWQVAHPPVRYFATEQGRVTRIVPASLPAFSDRDVAAFGADALRDGFTLDFVHYREQMTQAKPRFSEAGYQGYYQALTASNILSAVKGQRMNLSVAVAPRGDTQQGAGGRAVCLGIPVSGDAAPRRAAERHTAATLYLHPASPAHRRAGKAGGAGGDADDFHPCQLRCP